MTVQPDALTSLPTRATFDRALDQALDGRGPVALALLDVDAFVEINGPFGFDVGDRVLQTVAELLAEAAPGNAYRIAGDEFALLLPGLSLEQAFLQMEALRARVQGAPERFGLPDGRAVTISIGIAQAPRDAKTPRALLEAADVALGAAKENGANQVSLPSTEQMVMKSCYYPTSSINRLKALAKRLGHKESQLLREALDDLFRKYDVPREA